MALSFTKLFFSMLADIEPLSMEERGRLLTAMLTYGETGALPEDLLAGNERFLFPMCKRRIDQDAHTYEVRVQANRVNGAKGGRPSKNPVGFSETEKTQTLKSKEDSEDPEDTEAAEETEDLPEEKETEDQKDTEGVGVYRVPGDGRRRRAGTPPPPPQAFLAPSGETAPKEDAPSPPDDARPVPSSRNGARSVAASLAAGQWPPPFPSPDDAPSPPDDARPAPSSRNGARSAFASRATGRWPPPLRPPTLEAVREQCKKDAPSVDAERFWNYYQANGWRAAGQPIMDWRAKLREWELGDRADAGGISRASPRPDRPAPEPPNAALNYAQREYRDEDFATGFFVDLDAYA